MGAFVFPVCRWQRMAKQPLPPRPPGLWQRLQALLDVLTHTRFESQRVLVGVLPCRS